MTYQVPQQDVIGVNILISRTPQQSYMCSRVPHTTPSIKMNVFSILLVCSTLGVSKKCHSICDISEISLIKTFILFIPPVARTLTERHTRMTTQIVHPLTPIFL